MTAGLDAYGAEGGLGFRSFTPYLSEVRTRRRARRVLAQGAAGTVSQRYPINFSMGLGRGELQEEESGPAHIETRFNEHAQLWHYRAWAEWMAAGDWQHLRENHSQVPEGRV